MHVVLFRAVHVHVHVICDHDVRTQLQLRDEKFYRILQTKTLLLARSDMEPQRGRRRTAGSAVWGRHILAAIEYLPE